MQDEGCGMLGCQKSTFIGFSPVRPYLAWSLLLLLFHGVGGKLKGSTGSRLRHTIQQGARSKEQELRTFFLLHAPCSELHAYLFCSSVVREAGRTWEFASNVRMGTSLR